MVDQHPALLVVVNRGLPTDRLRDAPAGQVAEHLGVGEGPPEVPPAGAVAVDLFEVGNGPVDLVDRRAVFGLPLHVVVANNVDVDIRVLGRHASRSRAAEYEPEDGRIVTRDQLIERLTGRR